MSDVSAMVTIYWGAINNSLQSHPDIPVPPPSPSEGQCFCSNSAKTLYSYPDSSAKLCIF